METPNLPALAAVEASALTARLYEITRRERHLLVEFLIYLAEVDRRKVYADIGFSSCFVFVNEHLGYSRSATFRRVTAARLVARFPIIVDYLGDGRLSLTTLVELREVLDDERLNEILDRASGKNEFQVKELAAALRPRPAPPDMLRRLPTTPPDAPAAPFGAGPALSTAPPPPPPPPRIEPISEELRVLRMTVGRDFVADLEAVRAALSHQIPDGNLEKVIGECLRRTLRAYGHRKVGSGERYVPAAIRDEVWRRDRGSCSFVGAGGRRCGSKHRLELHHIVPFAKGGRSTVENLAVTCSTHNRLMAEREYGAEHVAGAIAGARRGRRGAGPALSTIGGRTGGQQELLL